MTDGTAQGVLIRVTETVLLFVSANRTAERKNRKNKSLLRTNRVSTGLAVFTLFHVALSVVGIVAGFVVVFGLISAKQSKTWTGTFLVTTTATSVTGFLFPFHKFLPSHAVGILSLVVLTAVIYALYGKHLSGGWRQAYAVNAMIALYLNVFVLIAQLFMKVPALKALAPTQTETPFKEAQLVALVAFVVLTILAAIKFRSEPVKSAV